ncbi:MAG: YidC/Oxa1 family membrane protein insertase [Patescibacteria group bacterium]|jgi:YidC/Oxa1 family membrane protein insertase
MNTTALMTLNEKALMTQILYQPLFNILMLFYVYLPGHDLGVAIIVLTLIIRLALAPSYVQTLRAQQELKRIQPEIDEIRKLHKDDQAKQSEALMKVYQANKVNPFSSCLPMLIQLPILYALYRVFMAGLNTDSLKLLYAWFPQMPTEINTAFLHWLHVPGLEINLAHPNIYLAVLAGVFQLAQSWLMMKSNPTAPGNGTMKLINMQMTYLFPIVTVFIGMSLPAALALYWAATTVFTVIQQVIVMKQFKNKETKQ